MGNDRTKILNMLKEGKITVEEADDLLSALDGKAEDSGTLAVAPGSGKKLRYLRVVVEPVGRNGKNERVNVRVPLALIRAGAKFATLLPEEAREKIEGALKDKGVGFSLSDLKSENIEELIEALGDMSVDVDSDEARVRVFCE